MAAREPEDLTRRVDRHGWRLDALDGWRKDLDKRVAVLESEVLTEREARRLSEALRANSNLRLTRWQQFAGLLVGLAAGADLIRGFVG